MPKLVPPVAAAYQLIVPALAVALKFTVPAPQRLAGAVAVIVGIAVTVTAVVVDEQPPVVVYVNVAVPAETPVMTPELSIVATAVLELVHDPELFSGSVLCGWLLGKLVVSPHLWAR